MDRCALFVDAGYVLADGAMAVHGTRRRESVSYDYAGLLQLLGNLAVERTRLPLLRCYWYEATVEGRRSAEHDTLADLPGVKLRVAKKRPGRREGVEGEIHRDLTMLARNKAVSDVMLVSGEEDLAQVIADVQDMGMRVTLLQIAADGDVTTSRALRQECDDFVAVSAEHLRPYIELISGAEPARADEPDAAPAPRVAAVNGAVNGAANGALNGNGYHGNGQPAATAYPQPSVRAEPAQPAAAAQQPGPSQQPDPVQPAAVQPDRADAAGADFPAAGDYAASLDYSAAADYVVPAADYPPADYPAAEQVPAADYGPAPDFGTAPDYGPSPDYGTAPDYSTAPEYAQLPDYQAPVTAAVPAPPRENLYAAPVPVPAAADERRDDLDRVPAVARLEADQSGYAPGAARGQHQRDGVYRESFSGNRGDRGDRLQPVPASVQAGSGPGGSAQVRRLPARGTGPAGQGPGQPPLGLPPAPSQPTVAPAPGPAGGPAGGFGSDAGFGPPLSSQLPALSQPAAGQHAAGQPTGGQPVLPAAPAAPMGPGGEPNGMGYAGARGASAYGGPVSGSPVSGGQISGGQVSGGPRPAFSAASGPIGLAGPGGPGPSGGQGFGPGGQPGQVGPVPGGQPDISAPAGPIGLVAPGGYGGGVAGAGPSLADAVQSAHEEGQAFGESVARDAPALWLEAVLARKPRMPSDLEARLLQGSTLPIDFLLHDEVRHALRRGFWDALERARR